MQSTNQWLAPPKPLDSPNFRLFALPYAGGGASIYFSWVAALAEHQIELLPIQLPGRENRLSESAFTDCRSLVRAIAEGIAGEIDQPYGIFGHSMGATLAYELCVELRKSGLPLPVHLFVSGRNAPHVPWPLKNMDHLNDTEFMQEVAKLFGNISDAVLQEPELLAILTPILRADFAILDKYKYIEQSALPCDLSILNSENDTWTDEGNTRAWEKYTAARFTYKAFDGDHFFINTHRAAVIDYIVNAFKQNTASEQNTVTFEL